MSKSKRGVAVQTATDPFLSPAYVMQDLNISLSTFQRAIRTALPFVKITERRIAVRESDYEKWKARRPTAGGRAA